jgi:hypothetical protein
MIKENEIRLGNLFFNKSLNYPTKDKVITWTKTDWYLESECCIRLKLILKEMYNDLEFIMQIDFNDALKTIVNDKT